MRAHDLWVESYQGEVLGETLFGLLAQREEDAGRRHQLETIEAATKLADTVATMSWEEFLGSFEPVTKQFLAKYVELVELSSDDAERQIARAYVAHEEALATFARRALGQEEGEPLERILALPHVAAAATA